jgi:hypothetical protein
MWHNIFHIIDRIEHSLREHNIAWLAGIGSALGMSVLFLGVLIQGGVFTPLMALFESGNEPAAVVGARRGGVIEDAVSPAQTTEPQTAPLAPDDPVVSEEPESTEPPLPSAVLIGEPVVRVAVGSAYTDDGAIIPDAEDVPLDIYVDGVRVEEVFIDTSVPGEHRVEYRPSAKRAGSTFRTVIVE